MVFVAVIGFLVGVLIRLIPRNFTKRPILKNGRTSQPHRFIYSLILAFYSGQRYNFPKDKQHVTSILNTPYIALLILYFYPNPKLDFDIPMTKVTRLLIFEKGVSRIYHFRTSIPERCWHRLPQIPYQQPRNAQTHFHPSVPQKLGISKAR